MSKQFAVSSEQRPQPEVCLLLTAYCLLEPEATLDA